MKGLICAAGRGLRFKELGKNYPKAILPYKEKPLLIHQIEWLVKQKVSEVNIVVKHQSEKIFDIINMYTFPIEINLIEQETQLGLSDAIYTGIDYTDESTLILLGDILPKEDFFNSYNMDLNLISVQEVEDYSRWCMVEVDGLKEVTKLFDKPKEKPDTDYAVSGIYLIQDTNKMIQYLTEQFKNDVRINNEFQFSYVLNRIIENDILNYVETELDDFGTLNEYLENKSIKKSRSFNELVEYNGTIKKSSHNKADKIIDEFNWYRNLPDSIKLHTPRIFSTNIHTKGLDVSYKMEKIKHNSLRDIFLYIDNSPELWNLIFSKCFTLLKDMSKFGRPNNMLYNMIDKTYNRLEDFPAELVVDKEIINNFMNSFIDIINNRCCDNHSLLHGDFCFSNLLYDIPANKLIMIDPRGQIFGSHYYDVAKLCHSVLWDYDFIDSELYIKEKGDYKIYNDGKEEIKKIFLDQLEHRYSKNELLVIHYITASLFLSMIPLHSHNINNQELYYKKFLEIIDFIDKLN